MFFLFVIVMFLYYLFHAIQVPTNSDYASIILEAKSIYEGNIFLSGWNLSTVSFYTTEIPLYVLGMMMFGYTPRLLYIIPSITYLITVLAAMWLVYDGKRIKGAILTLCFVGIPIGLMGVLALVGPVHIGAIALCFICFKLIQDVERKKILYLYFGILFCWILIGDPIALWIVGLPIVLLGAYRMIINHSQWRKEVILPLIVFLAVVLSKIVLKTIEYFGGFVVPGTGQVMFANIENLGRNTYFAILGILELFNANFFGRPLGSLETVFLIIHFIGLIFVFYVFAKYLFKILKNKHISYIDQLLVVSISITIVAYIFSNLNMGMGTTRYLIPAIFLITVLAGKWLNSFEWSLNKNIIFSVVMAIFALTMISPLSFSRDTDKLVRLQTYLKSEGLTYGYGTFWLSAPITLYSNDSVKVRQVLANSDEKIAPYFWLSEQKWYDSSANFIIYDSTNWGQVNKSTAINTFGKPMKELQFEDVHILVWDKDISELLSR